MSKLDSSGNHLSFLAWDELFNPQDFLAPHTIPFDTLTCNCKDQATQEYDVSKMRCGLTALNFVRLALKLESEGMAATVLLRCLISQYLIDETVAIMDEFQNADDCSRVEDILKAPAFQEVLTSTSTLRSLPGPATLRRVFSHWFPQGSTSIQAAVFSNSLESSACLQIPIDGSSIYALLDPHPRLRHPKGSAITLICQLEDVISFLNATIYIGDTLSGPTSRFSAHRLASIPHSNKHGDDPELAASTICSPLQTPSKQRAAMNNKFDFPHRSVNGNRQPVASSSTSAECRRGLNSSAGSTHGCRAWQLPLSVLQTETDPENVEKPEHTQRLMSLTPHSMAPFLDNKENVAPIIDGLPERALEQEGSKQGCTSLTLYSMEAVTPEKTEDGNMNCCFQKNPPTEFAISWHALLAQQLQVVEEMSALNFNDGAGEHARRLVAKRRREEEADTSHLRIPEASSSVQLDWQIAVQLQQEEMDGGATSHATTEDISRSSIFNTLILPSVTVSFECGICGELHDTEEKMILSDCGHEFCKDCLRNFTISKIDDGRYPIFCPACIADWPRPNRSFIPQDLIEKLDLSKEKLDRLGELQMVAHAIILQCPRCKETMNIDKDQFAEEKIIVCPLPGCGHKWCKCCLKTLASSQDRHRCKNSNIDRLMRRKGWKYCPGCRVPVQKESGCNHMTCGTPGCNVHFCYKCGVLMIDTTHGGDVGTTVTEHYNNCRLFERKWKCTIQ